MRVSVVLSVLAACAGAGSSLRVLVVFPLPGPSHNIAGHSLVDILLDAGHEVTYVTAFPRASPPPRLRYVNVSSTVTQVSDKAKLNLVDLARTPRPTHVLLQLGAEFSRRGMAHPAVKDLIQDTSEAFDLVIAEWFFSGLFAPLSSVFECPLVWYSAMDVSWQSLRLVHEASSPAYTLDMQTRWAPTQPYTFAQRAYQLWQQLYLGAWIMYQTKFVEEPAYRELYEGALAVRGRSLVDYGSLVHNGSLLLVNSHPPLGQRLPLPQSVQYVGGHHIELPVKPLPDDLKNILDNATNGLIYFSMGSNLKSKDFPEDTKRELVELLGQLDQTVIWKFEEKLQNLPRNLHILDWAPQTSILDHNNTVLFISHGGQLSLLEAIQFGVPIIGIPLFGDQFVNINLAVTCGCALRVDFDTGFPRKLKEAINEILANSSFLHKARESSQQFTSRVSPARASVEHWVRVAGTGGAPHLRSPALLLHTHQLLYIDLMALVLVAFYAIYRIIRVLTNYKTTDRDKKNK